VIERPADAGGEQLRSVPEKEVRHAQRGAFLLVMRGREAAGATLLGLLAASALAAHLLLIGGSPAPAAGLLAASAFVALGLRGWRGKASRRSGNWINTGA
jgi:hypothetical protein